MRSLVAASIAAFLTQIPPLWAADQSARTWEFHLATPGTYKVQVEHAAAEAAGSNVSYTISVGPDRRSRELELIANRPFIAHVVEVPSAQKMRVAIAGLPEGALKRTRVYAYNADYIPYREYFDPSKDNGLQEIERVRKMLTQPDSKIDLATFKLSIDKLVNPEVDVSKALKELDAMVRKVRAMPDFGASPTSKAIALQRFIYTAGPWNDHRPFEYDLDDPLGSNPTNKLLATYLSSRKGNCVTMPLLFVVLGQRVGVDVTLSTAPNHLLVKFRNEVGTWINLEATSGANPAREIWIRQQSPTITDRSMESGIYLQPLTKREAAAVVAGLLAEHYFKQEQYQRAIAISDLLLEYYSKDVARITMKGAAYGRLAHTYRTERMVQSGQRPPVSTWYYEHLVKNNQVWFGKAEALGWREETNEERKTYYERIRSAREEGRR